MPWPSKSSATVTRDRAVPSIGSTLTSTAPRPAAFGVDALADGLPARKVTVEVAVLQFDARGANTVSAISTLRRLCSHGVTASLGAAIPERS
jgi:hypothetical protein